jgi:hypothetical protein
MSKHPKLNEAWTEDEAWAAGQLAWERGIRGPSNPLTWWQGKQHLRQLETKCRKLLPSAAFGADDFKAAVAARVMRNVMEAIETCAMHEWPIPQWAAQPFRAAMASLRHFDVRTWDDAFGPAPYLLNGASPKKKREAHQRHMRALAIYGDINRAGLPIHKETFKKIGALHGVSGRTAEEDYTSVRKRMPKDHRRPLKRGPKARVKRAGHHIG